MNANMNKETKRIVVLSTRQDVTRSRRCHAILCFLFVALFQGATAAAQDPTEDPVRVVLLPQSVVDDTLVSIGQVSRLSGGSESLRRRVAKLDIAEFKLDEVHVTVAAEQVRFRLLLAGIDPASFRLEGAKRTIVLESDDALSLRKVLGSAERALMEKYPGDNTNVTMTPHKGVEVPVLAIGPMDELHAAPRVKAPVPSSGLAHVDVAILVNGKTREVVPVTFDIEVIHKKAPRTGQGSFSPNVRPAETKDYLIKTRDNVKIVARVGSASIEAVGEAQQDGQVGQIIRVRNVESNRIVHGRIEASGIVLVDY